MILGELLTTKDFSKKDFFKKLIVVANRLAVTVQSDLTIIRSPGGLVSGLESFLEKSGIKDYIWIGWPGRYLPPSTLDQLKSKFKSIKAHPVSISSKHFDKFYNGFCNKVIWPLFHEFPSYVDYKEEYWKTYVAVNKAFCNEVAKYVTPDSVVWVHDYHLLLLPSMLRNLFPNLSIGFFLHIPFPSPSIFMHLPWRKELIEGMLGADLIGFHIYEYTINFLRTLIKMFGIDHKSGTFFYQDRIVRAETFPMGIDFEFFNNASNKSKIRALVKRIREQFGEKKVIFSIDRLDYTKGIYNRLLAYEKLLHRRPDLREKVVLLIIIVPSRVGVEHYQRMKKSLEEKISEINGTLGTIEWTPVLYYSRFLNSEELIAHYLASDVILVTSLKDGMNLIAKEFVASKKDGKGVLILSEFAGSAKELGEALIVNPNSIEELASAIEKSLELSEEEMRERISIMQERLKRYDILKWGMDFLLSLEHVIEEKLKLVTKLLTPALINKIKESFHKAYKRILFLDYDGTLVPFTNKPNLAKPDAQLLSLLSILSQLSNTEVVLISGRKKEDLERWFEGLALNFICEHGLLIKRRSKDWEVTAVMPSEIKNRIKSIMEVYVDRLPRSFVEEKEFSVVFHYRNADPEQANLRVAELVDELLGFTGTLDISLILGNKIVEVKPAGINKGTSANLFLKDNTFDFILAIGDDTTDEDLFLKLPEEAITIKVGMGNSNAKYSLKSYADVRNFLGFLASYN